MLNQSDVVLVLGRAEERSEESYVRSVAGQTKPTKNEYT